MVWTCTYILSQLITMSSESYDTKRYAGFEPGTAASALHISEHITVLLPAVVGSSRRRRRKSCRGR